MIQFKHSCIFLTFLAVFLLNDASAFAIEKPVWAYTDFSHYNSSYFIENKGQLTDRTGKVRDDVKFYFTSGNMTAYFTPNSIIFVTHKLIQDKNQNENEMLRAVANRFDDADKISLLQYYIDTMKIVAASNSTELLGEEENSDVLNFYYSHCPQGILGVKTYKKIVYRNVYDNIDFVVYAQSRKFGFKYDFIVHKGGNPKDIKIRYAGSETKLNADGSLTVSFDAFQIKEASPLTYRTVNNKPELIKSYFLFDKGTISFDIPDFKNNETITIDPVINWSTYFGGSDGDHSADIALDHQANVIIAGKTLSKDLPVTNGSRYSSGFDLFVAKFDYAGKRLWATYYGGRESDYIGDVEVDPAGHIYVTGWTWDKNFPVTPDCFQPNHLGGKNEGILIKFNRNGQREWATYVGGYSEEHLYALTIDNQFNVITAGWTRSTNFPNGEPPINSKSGLEDITLVSFSNAGDYRWSTMLGGDTAETANDLAFDISGNIILTGWTRSRNFLITNDAQQSHIGGFWDAVVAKFSITGNLVYSSFLGGSGNDFGTALDVDSFNNIFVTGYTTSDDFPVSDGAFQETKRGFINSFIIKYSMVNQLLWSSYLGGSKEDMAYSLTIDKNNNVIVAGQATSSDFPVTINAVQRDLKGPSDAFGAKFGNDGKKSYWITYYGGDDDDLATGVNVDSYHNIYITGDTKSTDFPVSDSAFQSELAGQYDAFIFKHCSTSPYTTIKVNGEQRFCDGGSVELDAGPGFLFYVWSTGETTQKITARKSGAYTVHITDSMYCDFTTEPVLIEVWPIPQPEIEGNPKFCAGDSAVLTAPDGYISWEWSNGSKAKTIVLHSDQRIILSVTDQNGCKGYDTVFVQKLPTPEPMIKGPRVVCLDVRDIEYGVFGIPGHTYDWDIVGGVINAGEDYFDVRVDWTTPGTGILIIKETNNASGCTGYDTMYVEVKDHLEPEITSSKNRFIMCEGDTMKLDAGIGYRDYEWNTGERSREIVVAAAGRYHVKVSVEGDCFGYDTVDVQTRPVPAPVIFGDTVICEGTAGLVYTSQFDSAYVYVWEVTGGTIVKDDSSNTVTIDWLIPGKAKIRLIQYDTLAGCSGETELDITINPKPLVKIIPLGDTEFCEGDSVELDAGSDYETYLWSTGDTTRSVIVRNAGIYHLVAYNEFGCSNSDSIEITTWPRPQKPVITNVDDTLFSSQGESYIWYRNDTLLNGVNDRWFVTQTDGDYKVVHTNGYGCQSESDIFRYKYIPIVGKSVIGLPSDTIFVETGDPVVIPIVIESSKLLDYIKAYDFTGFVSFDGTVLVPDDIGIPFVKNANMKTVEISGRRQDTVGLLYTLYLHAALGDSVCVNVSLDSLRWDTHRPVEVIYDNCVVCLTNICNADGNRFYLSNGELRLKQNIPNPAADYTAIECETIETGWHVLYLIDVYGRKVMTVFEGDLKPGEHIFKFNTGNLSNGVYYYVLRTPSRILKGKMQVIR